MYLQHYIYLPIHCENVSRRRGVIYTYVNTLLKTKGYKGEYVASTLGINRHLIRHTLGTNTYIWWQYHKQTHGLAMGMVSDDNR